MPTDVISSTKRLVCMLWACKAGHCASYLSEDFSFVGPFDNMVAAGAVTVFLMPLLASVACTVSDIEPIETARRIKASPEDALPILHEQVEHHRRIVHDTHAPQEH